MPAAVALSWQCDTSDPRRLRKRSGVNDGPKLLLNSGIHGDELNGVRVIQKVMGGLSVGNLSGTVLAVPGLNQVYQPVHILLFGVI
jgi:predicted deacylase